MIKSAGPSLAQDATWRAAPVSGDFSDAANWTPNTVPTGTAFFGASSTTNLSFSNNNTLVGGWTFNPGAAAYSFTTNGDLGFTGAGIVVGGGSAAITSNFRLTFYNASTAGNAAITNNGYLYVGDTASAANSTILNNGVSFQFMNASSAGNSHVTNTTLMYFSDTSTAANSVIANTATGDFRFYNQTTAANATIVNGNLLYFNDASTAGAATIVNNSLLYFYNTSTAGQARLINSLGAIIDFSGSAGAAGDGRITAGSIEGAGDVKLGSGRLTVGSNGLSTTVGGAIQDGGFSGGTGGSLVKTGSGTLTLASVNAYTGATTVDAGTLRVTGSIAASSITTVNAGAGLTGTGTVGNTTIAAGGVFNPGNGSPGSAMTVTGNLALVSGALYMVQVSPTAISSANVTGTATLGGANVNAVYAGGGQAAKQYTILSATGGISGTFNTLVNAGVPAGFEPSLSYDANHVYLNLSLRTPMLAGLNINQRNVVNALGNFFDTTGAIPLVFGTLTPAGLTQASGEIATGSQQATFDAMNLFVGLLTDPFVAGRGDGAMVGAGATPFAEEGDVASLDAGDKPRSRREREAYAAIYRKATVVADPFASRWSVWAAGYGGSQTTDGNAALGSNTATSRVYGTAVGADYRLSPFTTAGFALAGGGTSFVIANGLGSGRSDLFQAGAFVRHIAGPAYVSAALAYGWQDVTTDRTVTIAGADRFGAHFDANAFSGRLEGGYRFVTPWAGITPYAAAQLTTFELPAYAEQVLLAANTFALAYGASSVTAARSELGLRSDKSWAMRDAIFTLRGRVAWGHDFNPDRTIAAAFQTLPGASFIVNGAAQSRDAALATASAEIKCLNGLSLAATFEGAFSGVTRSYAGKGVARYQW